ncbi:CHAT domain-containing protein [Granulicella arctica]|uniref:CHAT domain-containing protein n=1 Tax=Granulicella arctica TaxID=940613 RepID=UPI0021DFAE6C|nr:CHAT domain-containing protein [Granulicella arctica]
MYLYQGHSEDAAALLRQPPPVHAESSLVVRQNLLLTMAEARSEHREAAARAITVAETADTQGVLRAEILAIKGSLALEQGQRTEAERLFNAALALGTPQDTKFFEMQMWMNLGAVALDLEHYEDALERFNRASILAQSLNARLALEKVLGNLGWTYYNTGDFVRALQSSKIAETQAAAIGVTLDQVRWLRNAGMSQFEQNDPAAARVSFENSLRLAEGLHNSQEMLYAHLALSYLLLHTQPDLAASHIHEAARLAQLRQNPTEELEPMLLQSLLLLQQGQTGAAETGLLAFVKQTTAFPSLQWEAENTLARIYAVSGRQQEADHWYQRAITTFHQQRLSLKSVELELPFLENGSDLYLGYMEHLIHEGRTDDALKILDDSRAETLAEGLKTSAAATDKTSPVTAASIRTLAGRLHATILVYCLRPDTSYLWAINAGKVEFRTLAASTAILPLVDRQTQAILASKDLLTQKDQTGQQLYELLIKPAADAIGSNRRVFLIADKGLGALNFETLIPTDSQAHYWIEDVALTNARSLRLLAASPDTAAPAASNKLLLIGDPLYRTGEFPPLPNAAAEMEGVASHFEAAARTMSTGGNALPASYASSNPANFTYIHFVAHATANETNPLDSAIILSTPPNTPQDRPAANRLYARDILQSPVHAELVTISSCFGSGTRNYSGEGVVGLVWAFLRAGAHSVIGASWEVSDVSTPQLMDALYTHLLSGDKPDEALRSGKLAMIHGEGVFRKPLYWASFQLYAGR